MDKEARAGQVYLAYCEAVALVSEGTLTLEVAKPVIDALDSKWRRLREQYIAECERAAEDRPDDEPVPDCRCGADSSRGIGHARWCENREENY